jgi:signal transduction histidine kinase
LRHQQRASLHQVLREYQLLGSILLRFVEDESIRLMLTPPPAECVAVVSRLHHAVAVLLQETVETFVGLYTQTITDQSERLRQFTRMATHEWRQPLAPISTAVSLLRSPVLTEAQRAQTVELIARNVTNLVDMTYKLERLARVDSGADNASLQEVSIAAVAAEAARQLREMAEARDVTLVIADDMPTMIVDVGRLELALVNLLSNAIKYSDPAKTERVVEITGRRLPDDERRNLRARQRHRHSRESHRPDLPAIHPRSRRSRGTRRRQRRGPGAGDRRRLRDRHEWHDYGGVSRGHRHAVLPDGAAGGRHWSCGRSHRTSSR